MFIFLPAKMYVYIRSVNERGFTHNVECTCDKITLLQLENIWSCSVFSLAPIYQHSFYKKFMQSFNMWIKIPVYEIDFWTVVVLLVCEILGHQNIWKNQIAYCIYMYTLKGVGCVRVWTHLRYILVLEWCQQTVRYACNIHIAFVC